MEKLAPVFDSVEAAPEGVRPFLVEQNGKHVLNVDVNAHPETQALKNAYERTKHTAKELADKVKPWDELGLSPEQVRELKTKLETNPPKSQAELDSAIKQVRDQYEGKLGELTKSVGEKDTHIDRLVRESAAVAAIAKMEANATLLLPHVLKHTRTEWQNGQPTAVVIGKDGAPRIKDHLGTPMTIEDLVAEMAKDETYAPAFPAKLPSGGGAKPNGGGGGGGGSVKISRADAKDARKYQAARAQAEKAGVPLEFTD